MSAADDVNDDPEPVYCELCAGAGVMDDPETGAEIDCPECGGEGIVEG